MIHPEHRSILTDALTPPPGFVFDIGVATTYSLDLITLLTLPLHLVWLGSPEDDASQLDPLRIVESLSRTAKKLTVYCQQGKMQVPRAASPLFSLMEGMVHEVQAPHGGAFHPKVWLLKFVNAERSSASVLRLIVLSRNLTDDRSWDLSLNLDGAVGSRVIAANRPLSVFLDKTQGLGGKPLTPERHADLATLMHDVLRCEWALPDSFDSVQFHVLGLGKKPIGWLPEYDSGQWDELGVVSPFVRGQALKALADLSRNPLFVVSRADELDQLRPQDCEHFPQCWILDAEGDTADQENDALSSLKGLHAKAYAAKKGWYTHLFIGSANATDAALLRGSNVEFMVELVGKSSKVGSPAQWIGPAGMGSFIVPYVASEPIKTDADQDKKTLEKLRLRLCATGLRLKCSQKDDFWLLALLGAEGLECGRATAHVWPLSMQCSAAVLITTDSAKGAVTLGLLAEHDLTTFTGFSLRLGDQRLEFALDLPISGLPASRDLAVLRAAIANRAGFTRYLLLLLGDWTSGARAGGKGTGQKGTDDGRASADPVPLFEMLAWAFAHEPHRLDRVAEILERIHLEGNKIRDDIVPADFQLIWKSFQQALVKKGTR